MLESGPRGEQARIARLVHMTDASIVNFLTGEDDINVPALAVLEIELGIAKQ